MLKSIQPQKKKYHKLYIDMVESVAKQSVAERRKVGAVIVLPTGLISVGWNGTPAGFSNGCEHTHSEISRDNPLGEVCTVTKPEVIHAERNALDKLTRQGVSTEGAILFVTTAPCMGCAKSLASVGIKKVYYRDIQSNIDGLNFLVKAGVDTEQYT